MTTKAKSKTRKKAPRVSKTDGLSNLDVGESHLISDDEVADILKEELEETPVQVKEAAVTEEPTVEEPKIVNPLQALTQYEFQLTMSILPPVQHSKKLTDKLEELLASKDDLEVESQLLAELKKIMYTSEQGIWNSMAQKFGYKTLEDAQEAGIKLSIKSGHFIQATDA